MPGRASAALRPARASHHLASAGQVGEWGPASPSRVHHLRQRRRPLAGLRALLGGGFGWMLAAWIPSYAGAAVVFPLYPVLFQHAFGVATTTSALAFAVTVLVSLPRAEGQPRGREPPARSRSPGTLAGVMGGAIPSGARGSVLEVWP